MSYMSFLFVILHKIKYMRKYIYIGIAIVFTLTAILAWNSHVNSVKYRKLYEIECQNVLAYQIENSYLENKCVQHEVTIDELYASWDSIDRKLVSTMDELKIANKQIKELQYQQSQAVLKDTVKIHDTIFKEEVSIDTVIGDCWFSTRLQLSFPSTIIVESTCNSEQSVYIYNEKKYYKNPPWVDTYRKPTFCLFVKRFWKAILDGAF